MESYLNEISDKTKVLVRAVKKISTGTLREKLMVYFEELLESQVGKDKSLKYDKKIRLPITKKELAQRYGVARTSLSRELKKRMEDDGIILIIDSNVLEILVD